MSSPASDNIECTFDDVMFEHPIFANLENELLTGEREKAANQNFEEYEFDKAVKSFSEWTHMGDKLHRAVTFISRKDGRPITRDFVIKFSENTAYILWANLTSTPGGEEWLAL